MRTVSGGTGSEDAVFSTADRVTLWWSVNGPAAALRSSSWLGPFVTHMGMLCLLEESSANSVDISDSRERVGLFATGT